MSRQSLCFVMMMGLGGAIGQFASAVLGPSRGPMVVWLACFAVVSACYWAIAGIDDREWARRPSVQPTSADLAEWMALGRIERRP